MRAALHQPLVASRMVMTLALVACASERPSQPRVSEPMVQVTRAPEGVVEKSEPTEVKVGRSDFDELVVEVIAAFNQKQVPVLDRLLDSELGLFVVYPVGVRASVRRVESFGDVFEGDEGVAQLGWMQSSCAGAAEPLTSYSARPDPCSEETVEGCFSGNAQGFSFMSIVDTELREGTRAVAEEDRERARSVDAALEQFFYDSALPLGIFFGKISGEWRVLGLDRWDCSI